MVHDDVRVGGREVSVKVGRVMGAKDSPRLPPPASRFPLQSIGLVHNEQNYSAYVKGVSLTKQL